MREIEKTTILMLIDKMSSNVVNENIIHVLFQLYGHEREIDKVTNEVDKIEEK